MTAPVTTTARPSSDDPADAAVDTGAVAGPSPSRHRAPRRPTVTRPPTRPTGPDPEHRPVPAPAPARRVPPTGRLGILWGIAAVGSTVVAPALVAVAVAPVAAVAAASLVRSSRSEDPRRMLMIAAGAALVPVAAIGGWVAALVALAVEVGLLAVLVVRAPAGPRALGRSVMALGAPALAASSLVLADHGSTGTALSLVCAICLFDLANYVMGTGASGGILGAVSGMAAVGVFALLAAGVIDPPFSGARPWVAFGILALLAPLGVVLGRRMAGGARLPALQRLDSLLLAGPAWIVTTHVLLR